MTTKRYLFLDYLLGFAFLLMAFDHALHAYASNFGKFWFIRDYDRSVFFDALYLFNQSIIMPLVFFASGAYVIKGWRDLGTQAYVKNRLLKYGIPFILGVPLIVPLLTYPKYLEFVDSSISYTDYWFNVFLGEKLQAGPFWVMYALLLHTYILMILHTYGPKLMSALDNFLKKLTTSPWYVLLTLGVLAAISMGVSDLIWGAPWWVGFGKIFYLQGSRFIMNFIYFVLGSAFVTSGLAEDQKFLSALKDKIPTAFLVMLIAAIAYCGYSLTYIQDGAYADGFYKALKLDATFTQALPILWHTAPTVLPRTTLLGLLGLSQLSFLVMVFYSYLNKPIPFWQSLAANCYGIFIWHESVMVWLQFYFIDSSWPLFIKMPLVFIIGLSTAWAFNARVMKKIPGVRKII